MDKYKYFPSSTREWNSSIYNFNKKILNRIPFASISADSLIKSYFYLYNLNLEKKIGKKQLKSKKRKLSLNKLFLSKGEFKHTNNKLVINLFMFNRQRLNYSLILKNNYLKLFKSFSHSITKKFSIISKKTLFKLFSINLDFENACLHDQENYVYAGILCRKFLKNNLKNIRKYIYIKQMIYLNNFKYNYIGLNKLKFFLEKLFNKTVELNLINIKRFFLNKDILFNSITMKITKNRRKLSKYLRKFHNKIKMKKRIIFIKSPSTERVINTKFNILNKLVYNNLSYKYIYGYRLEAGGRLTKRYTASRSRSIFRYKGGLTNLDSSFKGLSTIILKGNLRSNVQQTVLKSKTRIGSFGLKGWLSGN